MLNIHLQDRGFIYSRIGSFVLIALSVELVICGYLVTSTAVVVTIVQCQIISILVLGTTWAGNNYKIACAVGPTAPQWWTICRMAVGSLTLRFTNTTCRIIRNWKSNWTEINSIICIWKLFEMILASLQHTTSHAMKSKRENWSSNRTKDQVHFLVKSNH